MATKLYPGVIFAESTGYSINFPDVPSAFSEGDTIEQCLAMGQEVLNLALETLADDKKEIPTASSAQAALEAAREVYPEGSVYTVQLMTGTIPERSQKYTITMEPELMKRIDAAAGNYGRSGWLAEAAREKLKGPQTGSVDPVWHEYIRQHLANESSAADLSRTLVDCYAESLSAALKDAKKIAENIDPQLSKNVNFPLFGRYRSLTTRQPVTETDPVKADINATYASGSDSRVALRAHIDAKKTADSLEGKPVPGKPGYIYAYQRTGGKISLKGKKA